MIVVLLPTELARRMVARLGKPGHRQAYPCSCVLGAIVRGRQRGHIREKFRGAKRLIIPGPGAGSKRLYWAGFRGGGARQLCYPQTLALVDFDLRGVCYCARNAPAVIKLLRPSNFPRSKCGCSHRESTPFAMFHQQSQSGLKGGRHLHRGSAYGGSNSANGNAGVGSNKYRGQPFRLREDRGTPPELVLRSTRGTKSK
jgi:hypothetical protein